MTFQTRQVNLFETYIEISAKSNAYNMMLINYLHALVGKDKKLDKNSMHFNKIESKANEITTFYRQHKGLLKRLKILRDKVFAHFDNEYLVGKVQADTWFDASSFRPLIADLIAILNYKGVPLKEKP